MEIVWTIAISLLFAFGFAGLAACFGLSLRKGLPVKPPTRRDLVLQSLAWAVYGALLCHRHPGARWIGIVPVFLALLNLRTNWPRTVQSTWGVPRQ